MILPDSYSSASSVVTPSAAQLREPAQLLESEVPDDRRDIQPGDRVLLVIEDDEASARILLDASMPGMDGFETASLMRQREKTNRTPIVFLTAIHKAGEQVFKGYAAGAVDYLFKPFTSHVLRSKVQAFVELYKARREIERHSELLESINRQLTAEIERRGRAEAELRDLNEKLEERVRERTAELRALSSHIQTACEDSPRDTRRTRTDADRAQDRNDSTPPPTSQGSGADRRKNSFDGRDNRCSIVCARARSAWDS